MGAVFIGTSGWHYKHWHAAFYPEGLPKTEQLIFYATQFSTVEINASFYRLPTEKTVKSWRDKAPDDFIYAVKGSRLITHFKKLNDVDEALDVFMGRMAGLEEHLGPILWQLPPKLHRDDQRLISFVKKLPKKYQHAVEFRDPSWNQPEVYKILKGEDIAVVWLSSQRMPLDFTVTADFVYGRFHGLEGGAAHDYTEDELKPWAEQIAEQLKSKNAFLYFNNDWNSRAPENAVTLERMVDELRRTKPKRLEFEKRELQEV
jgi:uncharacterized protein YecE (DUF72 family)